MNQKVLAGIGNTCSEEILLRAQLHPRLHPRASVAHLGAPILGKLRTEVRRVLKVTIEWEAKPWEAKPHRSPDSVLLSQRHGGERCPQGNGEIRKIEAAGRTYHHCPANRRRGDQKMARKAEWKKLKERSLKKFGEESIFGEGSLDSRLAVVGEAPGKHEVEEGRPFVGNAGKLLDELLEEAGIDRSKLYVTNVVKVRPTKESGGSTVNRPPRAGEIREGIDLLKEELDLVKPRALVLLGGTPAKAMIKKSFTLRSEHGTPFDTEFGMPALATYHPAYLLRLRGVGSEDYDLMRRQVVDDLGAAWEHAQGPHDG